MAKGNHILNPLFGYSGNRYTVAFDGVNDYFDLGSTPGLCFSDTHITSTGFTVTAWIYLPGSGSETASMPILNIGRENTNDYYGIQCGLSSGKPRIHVMGLNGSTAGAGSNNRRTLTATAALPRKRWNHVAWSCLGMSAAAAGSTWHILVNGSVQTCTVSGINASLVATYSGDSYIGNSGNLPADIQYINTCNLGDITVHAKQLSVTEIQNVYATNNDGIDWMTPVGAYSAADALSLKAWWQMGTPTGPPTYPIIYDDATASAYDDYPATMINMTSTDIVTSPLWG
tara:strand:+ start:2324 stop:3181 length:858 start_codon:yes stop_codon:yes gene_type:complete